jgi:hypothetical protein
MNYYNIQKAEQTYQLLDSKLDQPKLFYSMTLENITNTIDTFENTIDNQINTQSEVNEILAKAEDITNKLENIAAKAEDEVTLEDIKTIDIANKSASDLLDEEVRKALASVDLFSNVAVKILNNFKNKNYREGFENTDMINNISQINEIQAKAEEITNKLENIAAKAEDEVTLEDIKTIDIANKSASDLLEEEVQKALASIQSFDNVAITILNDMENKLLQDYSYDVSKENDHLQQIYLKAMNEEKKFANYLNNNPRLIEKFGMFSGVAKVAAKVGPVAVKAGGLIAKAGKAAIKFVAKHPKLVAAGVGLAAVGIYAASTKQSFGSAAQDLAQKGTNELKCSRNIECYSRYSSGRCF